MFEALLQADRIIFVSFIVRGIEGLSCYQFTQAIMAASAAAGLMVAQVEPITQADYATPACRHLDSRMNWTALRDAYGLV